MTTDNNPITQTDLHAYADGQLDVARTARVRGYLDANPDAAEQVRLWQDQNEALREAFAPAAELTPQDLDRFATPRRPGRLMGFVAALGLLVLGAASGYVANDLTGRSPPDSPAALETRFATEAGRAFLTYAAENRHAVEVTADEQDHLTSWLGNRLDHEFSTPDLSGEGFMLVGGRLLPINGRPGAMLLYEDRAGTRVSVIIARNNGMADTRFEWTRLEEVGTYHWIEGPISYAISGTLPADRLRAVSEAVYESLADYSRPGA